MTKKIDQKIGPKEWTKKLDQKIDQEIGPKKLTKKIDQKIGLKKMDEKMDQKIGPTNGPMRILRLWVKIGIMGVVSKLMNVKIW